MLKHISGGAHMDQSSIMKRIEETGIVPVIVIDDVNDAVPTAKALLAGGIDMMEITFRTACAAEAIAKVKKEVPGRLAGSAASGLRCRSRVYRISRFFRRSSETL